MGSFVGTYGTMPAQYATGAWQFANTLPPGSTHNVPVGVLWKPNRDKPHKGKGRESSEHHGTLHHPILPAEDRKWGRKMETKGSLKSQHPQHLPVTWNTNSDLVGWYWLGSERAQHPCPFERGKLQRRQGTCYWELRLSKH